jgi:MFS family permease
MVDVAILARAGAAGVARAVADLVGRKLLYTGGFLLFVLGSTLCGLAPNLPMLIAFRVLQAIGAAKVRKHKHNSGRIRSIKLRNAARAAERSAAGQVQLPNSPHSPQLIS